MGCTPSKNSSNKTKKNNTSSPSSRKTTLRGRNPSKADSRSLGGLPNGDDYDDDEENQILHLRQREILSSPPSCMDLSDDKSMMSIGMEDGVIEIWSTMSNPCESLERLYGHQAGITSLRFHGNFLVSGSSDSLIVEWSLMTMSPVRSFRGHTCKINQVICVGSFLFSTAYDRTARIWSLLTYYTVKSLEDEGYHSSNLSSSSENKPLETSTKSPKDQVRRDDEDEEEDRVRDVLEHYEGRELKGEPEQVDEEDIRRQFTDPSLLQVLRGHTKSVYPIAFIPADDSEYWMESRDRGHFHDRDLVVTGSADCTAIIWSTISGEVVKILEGHTAPIYSIVIDTESGLNTIFTAGGDGNILAFDPVTGDLIRKLIGHEGAILTMTTYKTMVYSGSTDRTARAWVMEFGEETRVFRTGKSGSVTTVEFLGGFVITGNQDGSIRVFDSRSGTLVRLFKGGHRDATIKVKAIPGKVFSIGIDGRLCIWNSKGLRLEVFGDTKVVDKYEEESEEDDVSDSSQVKRAREIIDMFLRER